MGLLEDYLAAARQQVLADRAAQLGGATPGGAVIGRSTFSAPAGGGSNLDGILAAMGGQAPSGGLSGGLSGLRFDLLTPENRAAVLAGLAGGITRGGQIAPQPFGSTGGSPEGTSPAGRGGDTSNIGGGTPNTGGIGMSAADAIAGGFGALGPAAATTSAGMTLGGTLGAEEGTNASAGLTGPSGGMNVGFGGIAFGGPQSMGDVSGVIPGSSGILGGGLNPSIAAADPGINPAAAHTSSGLIGHADAQNPGTMGVIAASDVAAAIAAGAPVSVSPSGVVSLGGEPVGVIGGGDTGGGSGYGGEGMGIGLGGVADGSSNAGIGGPGGTGAVGGAGDAGQGTGGPGEGDQFGNQYVVGGRGPPDSKRVGLTVSPGELITVTPPGDPKGRGLDDILRIMATMRRA